MKSTSTLKPINMSLGILKLLGDDAYSVYITVDPLHIFLDTKDGTFSVRGALDADDLTEDQLRDGILSFGEGDTL